MNVTSGPQIATLTGLAVGDALGMPFEKKTAQDPALVAWNGDFLSSDYHRLDPGQWTDDTVMARIVGESLLENRDYSPSHIAKLYVSWFMSGDDRGMGKTTKAALSHLSNGCPWVHSGIPGAEGNGTAMRSAPIGLFYRNHPKTVQEVARQEATITHDSDAAREGSVAVALGVAFIARGTFHSHDQNLANMVSESIKNDPLKYALVSAGTRARAHLKGARWQDLELKGANAHVLETVPAAFYAFSVTRSYRDAVELAIRSGGDTDTVAAITGALAGTFYGIKGVASYLPRLEDAEDLRALEQNLFIMGGQVARLR